MKTISFYDTLIKRDVNSKWVFKWNFIFSKFDKVVDNLLSDIKTVEKLASAAYPRAKVVIVDNLAKISKIPGSAKIDYDLFKNHLINQNLNKVPLDTWLSIASEYKKGNRTLEEQQFFSLIEKAGQVGKKLDILSKSNVGDYSVLSDIIQKTLADNNEIMLETIFEEFDKKRLPINHVDEIWRPIVTKTIDKYSQDRSQSLIDILNQEVISASQDSKQDLIFNLKYSLIASYEPSSSTERNVNLQLEHLLYKATLASTLAKSPNVNHPDYDPKFIIDKEIESEYVMINPTGIGHKYMIDFYQGEAQYWHNENKHLNSKEQAMDYENTR